MAALSIQAAQQDTAGIGEWAERCAPQARTAPPPLRTAVLAAAAWNLMRRGDPSALSLAEDALREGLPAGCPATYLPHMTLAAALMTAGRLEEGRAALTAGRTALDMIGAPANGHAHLYTTEGMTAQDATENRHLADAALAKAHESANPTALAVAWHAIAQAYMDDDPTRASTAVAESVALTRGGAGDGVYGLVLSLDAALHAQSGERGVALASLDEAIRYGRDAGNALTIVWACERGVRVMADLGRPAARPPSRRRWKRTSESSARRSPSRSSPCERRWSARIREELGAHDFDAAFRRGAAITYDETVDYLLAEIARLEAEPTDQ